MEASVPSSISKSQKCAMGPNNFSTLPVAANISLKKRSLCVLFFSHEKYTYFAKSCVNYVHIADNFTCIDDYLIGW